MKEITLNNGKVAKIISTIVENKNIVMVVGKLDNHIIFWDKDGYCENEEYNMVKNGTNQG